MKKKFIQPTIKVVRLAPEACLLSASNVDYDKEGAITNSLSNKRNGIFDNTDGAGMWE